MQILKNRVTDGIRYHWTTPNSCEILIIFMLLYNWINVVCKVIEQNWIKNLIVYILSSLLLFHLCDFWPLFFQISARIVLNDLHDLCDSKTIFSDLNTKLFGCLIFVLLKVTKTSVFEYFLIVIITKNSVWSDIINWMFINFFENCWIRNSHNWLLFNFLHSFIWFDFVFFILT